MIYAYQPCHRCGARAKPWKLFDVPVATVGPITGRTVQHSGHRFTRIATTAGSHGSTMTISLRAEITYHWRSGPAACANGSYRITILDADEVILHTELHAPGSKTRTEIMARADELLRQSYAATTAKYETRRYCENCWRTWLAAVG